MLTILGFACVPAYEQVESYACASCDIGYTLTHGKQCVDDNDVIMEGNYMTPLTTPQVLTPCGIIGCDVCDPTTQICTTCSAGFFLNVLPDNSTVCFQGCLDPNSTKDPVTGECSVVCNTITNCKILSATFQVLTLQVNHVQTPQFAILVKQDFTTIGIILNASMNSQVHRLINAQKKMKQTQFLNQSKVEILVHQI